MNGKLHGFAAALLSLSVLGVGGLTGCTHTEIEDKSSDYPAEREVKTRTEVHHYNHMDRESDRDGDVDVHIKRDTKDRDVDIEVDGD